MDQLHTSAEAMHRVQHSRKASQPYRTSTRTPPATRIAASSQLRLSTTHLPQSRDAPRTRQSIPVPAGPRVTRLLRGPSPPRRTIATVQLHTSAEAMRRDQRLPRGSPRSATSSRMQPATRIAVSLQLRLSTIRLLRLRVAPRTRQSIPVPAGPRVTRLLRGPTPPRRRIATVQLHTSAEAMRRDQRLPRGSPRSATSSRMQPATRIAASLQLRLSTIRLLRLRVAPRTRLSIPEPAERPAIR